MLSAAVVSMSCRLLPNLIIRDTFQEKHHWHCVTGLQIVGVWLEGYYKKMRKKDSSSDVVACTPIVLSRVEESKATFPKIKDVSFLCTPCKSVFVPHWWQTGRKGGIRVALVGAFVWLLVKVTPHQFCAYFWHQLSMLNALISHFLCLRNLSSLAGDYISIWDIQSCSDSMINALVDQSIC